MRGVTLHEGDCLDVLATLPEASHDACVTDPPYHLTSIVKRFSGAGTAGVAAHAERFRATLIEREPEYCDDIRERLAYYAGEGRTALEHKARKRVNEDPGPLFGG